MGTWTKIILTGLGWACGGPIGALLGYWLGRVLSSKDTPLIGNQQQRTYTRRQGPYSNTGTQQDVSAAVLVLIAAVMNADGVVKKSELTHVKKWLVKNYSEEVALEMLQFLKNLKDQYIPVDDVCFQIKQNTTYSTRYHVLDFLFGLANADLEFNPSEERVLKKIANGLGINTTDYSSIHYRHSGYGNHGNSQDGRSYRSGNTSSYSKDPYAVLGINSSATDEEVKKAYRRLAMKYHPDKMEGMGEEVKHNAEEQFKAITEAYDVIKAARGIK